MFAILPTLGVHEMFLLLVIGLLLYGRNLPQAGRTMGRFVAQLKRGFHDFKEQMDRDESLREVRKTFEDTTREMRNITALPRAIANPVNELRNLAIDTVNAPANDHAAGQLAAPPAEPPAETHANDAADEPHEPPPPAETPAAAPDSPKVTTAPDQTPP